MTCRNLPLPIRYLQRIEGRDAKSPIKWFHGRPSLTPLHPFLRPSLSISEKPPSFLFFEATTRGVLRHQSNTIDTPVIRFPENTPRFSHPRTWTNSLSLCFFLRPRLTLEDGSHVYSTNVFTRHDAPLSFRFFVSFRSSLFIVVPVCTPRAARMVACARARLFVAPRTREARDARSGRTNWTTNRRSPHVHNYCLGSPPCRSPPYPPCPLN